MPRIAAIDPKSDAPIIKYVHEKQSNTRLQLDAVDDTRDARGRILEKGFTMKADFVRGLFETNLPNYIEKMEESIAYRTHKIERADVLEARANERMVETMLEAVRKNPELAKELRSRLTSQQMSDKKEKAKLFEKQPFVAEIPAPSSKVAPKDDIIDLYADTVEESEE